MFCLFAAAALLLALLLLALLLLLLLLLPLLLQCDMPQAHQDKQLHFVPPAC
jgi:hypothetical protein